jgi:hypothetical protein
MRRFPAMFRNSLNIDAASGVACLGDVMEKWQREDFEAMDPCLRFLAGYSDEEPAIRRFWRQRSRGHSKTSDIAAQVTYLLWAGKNGLDGMAAAEDKDQAKLLRNQMHKLAKHNPWLAKTLDYNNYVVKNKETGATLTIMSRDTNSSWGLTPDFVIADEFTHWSQQEFWSSVFSSFAKKPTCMLIVGCNAGAGRDWKWKMKEMARQSPLWHYSAPPGIVASWFTKETIDEQKAGLPPTVYSRLWLNEWQETGGEFVSMPEAEACRDDTLKYRHRTENDGWKYVAVLDYAPKKDNTVGVVMHLMGNKIIIDRMDVIKPTPDKPTPVKWVETWMENIQHLFGGQYGQVHFVLDAYQLMGVTEDYLEKGYSVELFDFASGKGNWELSTTLRQLIVHKRLAWYPGCGEPTGGAPSKVLNLAPDRDDLEVELASLVVELYSNGRRWRFNHLQDEYHHDDRAFAIGAGCHYIIKNSGGFEHWDISMAA